jgi:tRNA threonylcarbamoyl adenosine modification protein (Sua5/YciO/YrdC/YwlC family)
MLRGKGVKMTKIIKMNELKERELLKYIQEGKIIIYPTDTIYGIGCDAKNTAAVQKIREIKNRTDKPFSIIAPSRQWIYENFEIKNKNYVEKLPGPYTFILQTKKQGIISHHASNGNVIGVRIPNHKITALIQKAKTPFITTSITSEGPINDIRKIPGRVLKHVDLVVDDGPLNNQASVLIDMTGDIPRIVKRV